MPSWRAIIPRLVDPRYPVLMIRMLIIGYVFAIRSERALCREVQVNFAYRWFCGLSIEDKVPDHSRSRVRATSGLAKRHLPERVRACRGRIDEGWLVGGAGFAVDASLIAADANKQCSIPGAEWNEDIDPSRRGARSKSIWQCSTIRPTARQVTPSRSSFLHPILPPNGRARCADLRSSPMPTTI